MEGTGWANAEVAWLFNWDDGQPGEDCLRLNIWTPALKDNRKRPVMVWLHGGGFVAGSGQEHPGYNGENLSRRGDVVVVTINHRLGVLGYLNFAEVGGEKYIRSANAGMLDIGRVSNGCATTSHTSAAIPAMSPSSANRAAAQR